MTQVFYVEGMSCAHCVKAVTEAVSEVKGVKNITVDLKTGAVSIEGQAREDEIRTAIEEEGYKVK